MSSSSTRLESLTPEERKRLALRLRMRKAAEAGAAAAASAAAGEDRAGTAFPLTFQQQRLWLLDRMSPGASAYNMPGGVRLTGPLDADALARAFEAVVRRHEVLRSRIEVRDGEPVQVVLPPEAFSTARADLSHLDEDAREAALHDLAADVAARPFRLDEGPLARASVVRLGDEEHALLWALHHAVSDGWSTGILLAELTAFYGAFTGTPEAAAELPPLPLQYGDHALAQRQAAAASADAAVESWADRLRGAPHVIDLPTDRPHAAIRDPAAATVEMDLPRGTPERVARLARQADATPFMVYLALLELLLGRYARQDDLLVGTAVANRPTPELERLIGFFTNTLVLRGDLAGDPLFLEHLRRVRRTTIDAFEHQDVPFEKLVEVLNPERSLSHQPLVQVAFAFQNVPRAEGGGLPGIAGAPLDGGPAAAKFDLSITFVEVEGGTWSRFEYAEDVFDAETIRRMARHYAALLDSALDTPTARLSKLTMLAPGEREQVLDAWSEGPAVDAETTVTARFAAQVRGNPGAIAIEWDGGTLTYAELAARADALAAGLRAASVGAEDRVGVFLRRGPDAVVAMLAALQAGAAYVPLDPGYPAERLAVMADDADLAAIVTELMLRDRLPAGAAAVLDVDGDAVRDTDDAAPPAGAASPDALAYVIYTSGSTGTPKGAAVPHRAVVRLVAGGGYARFGPDRIFLQLAPLSFDAATFEVWGALLNGGRLVIPPADAEPVDAVRWGVRERGVTTLWLTAGLFHLVADEAPDALEGLEELLAGGDVLSPEHVRGILRQHPGLRLVNGYGPTENTTFTTCADLTDGWQGASVPIGRPIGGTGVRILGGLDPVPPGVPGELYAFGEGLARGYHGRPALTAERFLPDPCAAAPGARMYRTGDVARWRGDGQIEFMGRADQQVKVRGFRIEPGEIEAALLAHPDIREAVVLARRDGTAEARLMAYAVPHEACAVDAGTLRDWLGSRLPDYLVPSAVVLLDALPLTPNGKVDRGALPEPAGGDGTAESAAPRTPMEEVAAGIWAEVLGLDHVGRADDFFAIGGHSLVAARVVTRVRERVGVDLPLRALFEAPQLESFAARVQAALRDAGGDAPPPLVHVDGDDLPLSFAQERLWFIHRLDPASPAYNMSPALRLRGELDAAALERALGELVRRHESLRTHFPEVDGAPVQRVEPWTGWTLRVEDLSEEDEDRREAGLVRRATAAAWAPFDLERGPLFRATLLRLADDDHALLLGMHHAVSDGWSMGIFFRELAALYAAFAAGEPSPLPTLPLRYADFAAWQRAWLRGDALARQIDWWRDRLAGAPPVLELPTDRPRPARRDQRGAAHPFLVPAAVASEVRALARREGPRCSWSCSPPTRPSSPATPGRTTWWSAHRWRGARTAAPKGSSASSSTRWRCGRTSPATRLSAR
jgi:amino acid adenylation domain-containing protein